MDRHISPVPADQRTYQQWVLFGQRELDKEGETSHGPLTLLHVSGSEFQIFHCYTPEVSEGGQQTCKRITEFSLGIIPSVQGLSNSEATDFFSQ